MKKLEYDIEEWFSEYVFNELWKEWWELSHIDTQMPTHLFIFRREIEEKSLQTEPMEELIDRIQKLEKENEKLKDDLYIWKLTARDYARQQWVDLPELSNI